jgi:hypothetical protein
MLLNEREVPITNLCQDILDAVGNGFNVFEINGSRGSLNAVSSSENVRKQVGALIRGWVSLQREKALVQRAQMFFEFRLKRGH